MFETFYCKTGNKTNMLKAIFLISLCCKLATVASFSSTFRRHRTLAVPHHSLAPSFELRASFFDDIFGKFLSQRQTTDGWARARMIDNISSNLLGYCEDPDTMASNNDPNGIKTAIKRLETLTQGKFDLDPEEIAAEANFVPLYVVSADSKTVRKAARKDAAILRQPSTEITFNLSPSVNLARNRKDGSVLVLTNTRQKR